MEGRKGRGLRVEEVRPARVVEKYLPTDGTSALEIRRLRLAPRAG